MAVYTPLTAAQVEAFVAPYELGAFVGFEGIAGGIENTNYFVTTKKDGVEQQWVLTLFEELGMKDMPYFTRLTAHLVKQDLPVPAALRDRDNKAMKSLADRPALLLPKFSGKQTEHPTVQHCQQIGVMLGKLHNAARYFPLMREAHRGPNWWRRESKVVAPHLSAEDRQLLLGQVEAYEQIRGQGWQLPQGTIHGDLFVDNVLFEDGKLSAVIDFYNACTDYLLFDLAVAVNDWCVDEQGRLIPELADAFVSAYASERPFEEVEYLAWPLLLQTAAMRFWLSRLITFHRLEEQIYETERVIKDPEPFRQILLNHIDHPARLSPSLLA